MKILLVCSGGMSTAILLTALKQQAEKLGIKEFIAEAVGFENVPDHLDGYEILLVAPQVRHKFNGLKQLTDEKKKKIYQILPTEYAPTGAPALMQSIIKVLK